MRITAGNRNGFEIVASCFRKSGCERTMMLQVATGRGLAQTRVLKSTWSSDAAMTDPVPSGMIFEV